MGILCCLQSSKFKNLVKKYMKKGVGPVFTFGVNKGLEGKKIIENVKIFSHVANVGDTRSLILHPASTTHNQLTKSQKIEAGAGEDVIRLSVGLEDVKDLIKDLNQALARL